MELDEKALKELADKLGLSKITSHFEAEQEKQAEIARKNAEEARIKEMIAKASSEDKAKLEEANALLKGISEKMSAKDATLAETLKAHEEEVKALREQIAEIHKARDGRIPLNGVTKAMVNYQEFEKNAEDLYLLSSVLGKGVFETKAGAEHFKAVNSSSSYEVSSEAYETIFSTNILRDIQKELKLGALFGDPLDINAKNITFPIQPGAKEAKWVDAATYGTSETTGAELSDALEEVTFSTFKLAAKAFITDETEEDTIISLLPLIRQMVIEAHVNSIEKAYLSGTGVGQPKGLLTVAKADSKEAKGKAKADGSVKVTAAELSNMRRALGAKGLKLESLALIVSMDAYYDLLEDQEFQDVTQVTATNAVKLTGQVGRIYGMPVIVSEFFEDKKAGSAYAVLVYLPDFVIVRQRKVTVESERIASSQRYNIYVTQRVNLERYFKTQNVASLTYL